MFRCNRAELSNSPSIAAGQRFKTLREAYPDILPTGVWQHEVIEHVWKWLASDGYLQLLAVRVIALALSCRQDCLRKHNLVSFWSFEHTPIVNAPPQSSNLPRLKPPWIGSKQPIHKSFCFQSLVPLKHRTKFRPDLGKWICSSPPRTFFRLLFSSFAASLQISLCCSKGHASLSRSNLLSVRGCISEQ